MSEALAHSGGHSLEKHLQSVAILAADFSQTFDAAPAAQRWAYLAGLWHDLGKYRPGFQRYMQLADNPENAHIEGKVGGRENSSAKVHRSLKVNTDGSVDGGNLDGLTANLSWSFDSTLRSPQ